MHADMLPGSERWQNLAGNSRRRRTRSVSGLYDTFMQSRRWREIIAPPIRERARGHCESCRRKTARLEVHHKTYARFGGRELPQDLEALCEDCHRKADQARREAMAVMEREREASAYDRRYAGFMNWKYGEDWHRMHYAYSLASLEEFEETTREWEEQQPEEGGYD